MKGSVVASSPLLYVLIAIGLIGVVIFALVCAKKAAARCLELGISRETINNVIKATVSSAIVPSIAILLGFVTLSVSLGAAWPWWRLSVIGSLSYEVMASQYTADGIGVSLSNILSSDATVFGAVILVMTIGVLVEPLAVAFLAKKYSTGIMNAKSGSSGDWGTILSGCFFTAMFAVYLPIMFFTDLPTTMTLITSLVITVVCGTLSKKIHWIGNFTMAFALIISMCSSVLWVSVFK